MGCICLVVELEGRSMGGRGQAKYSAYAVVFEAPGGLWRDQVRDLMEGYREQVGDILPPIRLRESWRHYLCRVAQHLDWLFGLVQIWAVIPEAHHNDVWVEFYGKPRFSSAGSDVVARVNIKTAEYVVE